LTESNVDVSTTYTLTVTDNDTGISASDDVQVFIYFCEVGIEEAKNNPITVSNSYGFSFNNEDAIVSFQSASTADIFLYDLHGKCIVHEKTENPYSISSANLTDGVYMLHVDTKEGQYTSKLIKH